MRSASLSAPWAEDLQQTRIRRYGRASEALWRSSAGLRPCRPLFGVPLRWRSKSSFDAAVQKRFGDRPQCRDHIAGEELQILARQFMRQSRKLHQWQQIAESDLLLIFLDALPHGFGAAAQEHTFF